MKRIFRVILSVSLLGVSLIGSVFFVLPSYQEFAALRAQAEERRSRIERGKQALAQMRKVEQEVIAQQENFDKIDEAIPKDTGLPALYEHIQQLGAVSGLVVRSIEGASVEGPSEETVALAFTVNLSGSYEGLKNFLDEARRSARIFNVNTISVSASGQSAGELQIVIELFAYASP